MVVRTEKIPWQKHSETNKENSTLNVVKNIADFPIPCLKQGLFLN